MHTMADATLVGISATAVGFVLGNLSDLFKHHLVLKRDREARMAERKETRTVQRNEFQRRTLRSLQHAITSLMDATIESYRGYWAKSIGESSPMSSIDLDRAYWKADARAIMLQVRVDVKEVRNKCVAFRAKCSEATDIFPDHEKSRAALSAALEANKQLHDEIGKALLSIDDV